MRLTGTCITKRQGLQLSTAHGRITDIKHLEYTPSHYILPGFFDIQVNGYCGFDYTTGKITVQAMERLVKQLAAGGVTRHAPTLVSSSKRQLLTQLKAIDTACMESSLLSLAIPLIHMEGPFISGSFGALGAHDPDSIRDPCLEEYYQWKEASGNRIGIITLAPERAGALAFIEAVCADGATAAIGHTEADIGLIREAVQAGANLSTHLGNGLPEFIHRHKNPLTAQLSEPALWTSLISDGEHIPDEMLRLFCMVKGTNKLILISDIVSSAGLPPGRHRWGKVDVNVSDTGRIELFGSSLLAGAAHMLPHNISRIVKAAGIPLESAVSMCTVNPARLTGLPPISFMPEKGSEVNITLCRYDTELLPEFTMLGTYELFATGENHAG